MEVGRQTKWCSSIVLISLMLTQLPFPHIRDSTKGRGWVRSQLCTPLSFVVQKGNKMLCRNTLLCACGDLEVSGKILPLGNPKSLRCRKERGEQDGELFSLMYI